MKIQDVKPVNEDLANVIGDYGASQVRQLGSKIKGMFGKGDGFSAMSGEQRQVMDMFIRDLVGDASGALTQAIATGMVDPNLSTTSNVTPANPPRVEPTIPQLSPATPKVAPGNANAPDLAQQKTSQNINNYVRKIATDLNATTDKRQKVALTKEIVNFMADRKNYPEWQNTVAAVQQIIKKHNADPNFATAAITKLKAGQTMTEAWRVYFINKLLEAVNLTFNDLGLVLLKENKKNGRYIIAEAKFYKLNKLFEGIVNEAMSVADFLKKRWLPAYARKQGIAYETDMADIERVIDEIGKEYSSNRGKVSFPKLGQLLYAIRQSQPVTPQAPMIPPPTAVSQSTQATQTQPAVKNSGEMAKEIKQKLMALQKTDAAMYKDLISKITNPSI
jgi:hypothetical protein